MKTFTTVAAALAFLSTSYAATVSIEETKCLHSNAELEKFTIETDKLVVKELKSVCGLKITSADGADVNAISCQAYKDAEGKELGSAKFTFAKPAEIATNPVQEGSIRCDTTGGNATATTTLATNVAVSSGTGAPTPGGNTTAPTAPTQPSGSEPTGTGAPEGAAARMGLSVAAVAGAFAVFML